MRDPYLDVERAAERADEAFREEFFEFEYPELFAAVEAALTKAAAGSLYLREDLYEEMQDRLCADIFDFSFRVALAKAGREPFNPWIPFGARRAAE